MKGSFGRNVLLATLLSTIFMGSAQAGTATRTSAFEYDPATGLLTKEIIEPDLPQMRLETAYTYDVYGNRITATVSSPATGVAAIAPRGSSSTFDVRGQFAVSSTNAVGHTETRVTEPKFGNVISLTGPNGLTTTWQYDAFGRKILETRADGNQTKWEYLYCNGVNGGTAPCPSLAKYLVQVTPLNAASATNGAWARTYYDSLAREIRSETQGFDGTSVITKDTEYNSLGQVYRVSDPYYAGQTKQWTVMSYDGIGRVIATTAPDNTQSIVSYNGLITSATNALNQTQSAQKNSQGQTIKVTDAANNNVFYEHDPFGNLTKTTDSLGNITTLTYDHRGRKVGMVDPNMGSWSYEYNALGELVRQTDAKSQVTTLVYDLLGRLTSRAEADLVSTWTFDSCTKGIGKPCTATTDNGYSRSHSYDSLGRANATTTVMDTSYGTSVTFDANGRVATQTYPTGFAVKYVYTALGYLKEVRNNATNALFWQADTMDAKGHLLQQTYGNGIVTQQVYDGPTGRLKNIYAGAGNSVQHLTYTYDSIGNMQARSDDNQGLTESFLYDSLNRLTSATVNSPAGLVTQTFGYNAIGNIMSKSDVGTYTYGTVNNRPHAVLEIAMAAGGKRTYQYDANGALTTEIQYDAANNVIATKGRIETYTSFGMANAIAANGMSAAFIYGPEHQRTKQIAMSATTFYLHPDNKGGLFYEKDLKLNGDILHKHFITAGGQVVAQVKLLNGTETVQYFHRDHLGSTTAVTDAAGNPIEHLAYEAFGKRRFPNGTLDPNGTIAGLNTDRGFTNHEHLEELGLIHMNGRIYDPTIGRFMSADPIIQSPYDTQSFNRYAYVMNNPLAYIDPSGYSWLSKTWKKVWHSTAGRILVTVAVGYFTGYYNFSATAVPSFGIVGTTQLGLSNALVGGFAGSFAGSGGNFKAGLQGAFSAALFYGAGGIGDAGSFGRIAAHAAAGCIGSAASGGKCGDGALAAGFAEGVGSKLDLQSDLSKLVARTVIGGTASALGGGKFSNGAISGAFGYMFNHCLHGKCDFGWEQALYDFFPGYAFGTGISNGQFTAGELVDGALSLGAGAIAKAGQAIVRWGAAAVNAERLIVTETTKVLVQAEGRGGIAGAERLFDALPRTGAVSSVDTPLGIVRTVELQGGGSASIRPFSKTNPGGATVQIDVPGSKTIKIRYD